MTILAAWADVALILLTLLFVATRAVGIAIWLTVSVVAIALVTAFLPLVAVGRYIERRR